MSGSTHQPPCQAHQIAFMSGSTHLYQSSYQAPPLQPLNFLPGPTKVFLSDPLLAHTHQPPCQATPTSLQTSYGCQVKPTSSLPGSTHNEPVRPHQIVFLSGSTHQSSNLPTRSHPHLPSCQTPPTSSSPAPATPTMPGHTHLHHVHVRLHPPASLPGPTLVFLSGSTHQPSCQLGPAHQSSYSGSTQN